MSPTPHLLQYQSYPIHLEVNGDVMINATEMAKPFGKFPKDFLKTTQTQDFIDALIRWEDSPNGNRKKANENSSVRIIPVQEKYVKVVQGGDKQGTWMCRKLALKFAAWLDPHFEIWVFDQIERIIFESYEAGKNYLSTRSELMREQRQLKADLTKVKADYKASDSYKQAAQLRKEITRITERIRHLDKKTCTQLEIDA